MTEDSAASGPSAAAMREESQARAAEEHRRWLAAAEPIYRGGRAISDSPIGRHSAT